MSTPPQAPELALAGDPTPDVPAGLGRLGPVLGAANLSLLLPYNAAGTLVQALLEQWDEHTKLSHYAILTTSGAVAAMVANIGFGVLSDRTRSRWGRRNPWILGGSLGTAIAGCALSFTHSFPVLVLLWIAMQIGLNAVIGPLAALLPDRVAQRNLGRASAWIGIGSLLALTIGGAGAGLLVAAPAAGLRWIFWLMPLGGLLIWLAAPDRSSAALAREPFTVRKLLQTALPPRDADYLWALLGRLLTGLGLNLVLVYQLYILTDYLNLSTSHAGSVIAVAGALTAVTAGIGIATAGPLSDRLGRRKIFVVSAAAAAAVSVLPLVIVPSLGAFFTFVVVAGLGYGCYVAVDQVVMAEVLPDGEHRAKDLGILNIANTMPQVLAPVIAVAVVPGLGYRPLLAISIVLAAAGGLCMLPIRRVT
ncbi:MFS transporter [Streptomyces sp. NPDC051963]|uniref:MFS transporter n=1 Tax=Streptomyces sp. NPDC051963 TaxID=3365678 RepID=UPI0037D3576B